MVSDDRGQLILVGAIAIALVLLGLVLVVDTVLFTQVVGSEGTIETTREGGVGAQELGDALAAQVHEENLREDSLSQIQSLITSSPDDEFEAMLVNSSLNSGGAFVSVDGVTDTEPGTVIRQTDERALTNSTGEDDWSVVPNGDVGHFNLTLDTIDSNGNDFDVVAIPDAGPTRRLEIDVVSTSEVELTGAGTSSACGSVVPHGDTLRVDARNGRVYENSSCTFDLFEGESPYELRFEDGDGVNATYAVVTDQTTFPVWTFSGVQPPERSPAVWSFAYEFTYDTDDATVESERREVDVYD